MNHRWIIRNKNMKVCQEKAVWFDCALCIYSPFYLHAFLLLSTTPSVEYQQLLREIIYGIIIALITQRRVDEEREALIEENTNGERTARYQVCV